MNLENPLAQLFSEIQKGGDEEFYNALDEYLKQLSEVVK